MSYIDLQVSSNFSFLRGGSHPDELVKKAFEYDYPCLAITDRNTLSGLVRAHMAAKKNGMRLIVGCRLDLVNAPSLLAYPRDKDAYCRISALLTKGNLRSKKGQCQLFKKDVFDHAEGSEFIIVPPITLNRRFDFSANFKLQVAEYREKIGPHVYLAGTYYFRGNDEKRLFRLSQLAEKYGTPLIATNDVLYDEPDDRELQDILTCIREKCTIQEAGQRVEPNAERHIKPLSRMISLFHAYPDAVAKSLEFAQKCQFSFDDLKYEYPDDITSGRTPQEELTFLTWEGAKNIYGGFLPQKTKETIEHELKLIGELDYAKYFLTVHGIVKWASDNGILCQGRGSAANSAVCFCLGITSVDPAKFNLLFERFISTARDECPDIDVDFEHERREEVIQHIYSKYGRDRAAIVGTVTQYRQKSAIQDVGKAMGLSRDTITALSETIWQHTNEDFEPERIEQMGIDTNDPFLRRTLYLADKIQGFPRHLGQHSGGFVLTNGQLSNLCPIHNAATQDRTTLEFNKDDISDLGFLKIDVLALGILTCIRKTFDLIKTHYGRPLTLATIPQDDPAVYEMCSAADTVGLFQIESRAQQNMLPRLRPKCFYDLVIEVAVVRPGPIQGNMVHPYLRRRNGEEEVTYPSKDLEEILSRTLGIPLFQEQAMQIAIVAAGFTPAEADNLRRSMATFKFQGMVKEFEEKLIKGMLERGYPRDYAENIFNQLVGFGSYGFPESHAASFASLVYASAWLKFYYPDAYGCALLNSQPMGFYAPQEIIDDMKDHAVKVRPIDVNYSFWENSLEIDDSRHAVRLGFRQITGLKEQDAVHLIRGRSNAYQDISALWNAGVPQAALERLARANAFGSIGKDRRYAQWDIHALCASPGPLFSNEINAGIVEEHVDLPDMTDAERIFADLAAMSVTLDAHPVSLVRENLKKLEITSHGDLKKLRNGSRVRVAGLVLSRQRPGTAGGVCFITLKDETGLSNNVAFERIFQRHRKEVLQSKLLMAEGRLQVEGPIIHVIPQKFADLTYLFRDLDRKPRQSSLFNENELPKNLDGKNRRIQVRQKEKVDAIPKTRNFR